MGYDCTFHLVDERRIREEFVPKLLGLTDGPTPLDAARGDEAAELWSIVRRALEEGVDADGDEMDDEAVASLVCQLALMYSACSLPYHYERGLALSLWPEEVDEMLPPGLTHSPEPLFEEVVRRHPNLRGEFPVVFTGNYSTGVYLPADRVAEARRWVESAVAPLPKGDRRQFRGLLAVLRAAEERKLAYWEATDLSVPVAGTAAGDPDLMTADFLGNTPTEAPPADKVPLPSSRLRYVHGRGDVCLLSQALPDVTVVADLSVWPPAFRPREQEFAWATDSDRDGRWLLVSRRGPKAQHEPVLGRVCRDPGGEPELLLRVEQDGSELPPREGFLVAGHAVLVPRVDTKGTTQVLAWMQERPGGTRMIPAPGLPPHAVRQDRLGAMRMANGVARLAGGSEVFVWDGEGYEWDGRQFRLTFPLGLAGADLDPSAVPAGDDGFYFLADSKLYEVHRGGKPAQHAPRWTNIMSMLPGPAGGLLLREGDNPDGDIGKLYFPADGSFIHIEPELLGDNDLYDFLCWSGGTDRIIASDFHSLQSVPTSAVLGLPREKAE